jgi:hypothetical protein
MRIHAAISGVPGKVEYLSYPSSFEQRKALRELVGDGEQQPLGSALAILKGVTGG